MFASSSLEEIYHYVYYQIVSLATTMLDEVNGYTVDLFSNSVISSILGFFSTLAWGLGLLGAVIAVMDFGVSYRTGGGGSFLGTGMNMLRLLIAL
ncbi:MAG: conjugal transfer protein TrbL family protein, partial [Clostridia bacterium]